MRQSRLWPRTGVKIDMTVGFIALNVQMYHGKKEGKKKKGKKKKE
jgi:hypothetical protein